MAKDEAAVLEPDNDDVFAQAFAQISGLDDKAAGGVTPAPEVAVKPAEGEAAKPAEGEAAKPAEGEAAVKPAEGEAAVKPAEGEAAKVATPEAQQVSDEELLKRMARLVKEPTREEPRVAPQQPQEPALFSDDELKFITDYEKEWPDVARAEALRRRAEYRQVVGYVFQEISKELQPLAQMVRSLSERTHLGDLHTAVPDYDTTRDQVISWAQKQPVYLQPAYKHVIERGTVDEVADLIQRWRRDTGVVAAAPAAATAAARPKEIELPRAAQRAAAALAPVASKRSTPVTQANPEDFDGAFAAFANNKM